MRAFAWLGSVTRDGIVNDELAGSYVGSRKSETSGSSRGSVSNVDGSHATEGVVRIGKEGADRHVDTIGWACTSSTRRTSSYVSMKTQIVIGAQC